MERLKGFGRRKDKAVPSGRKPIGRGGNDFEFINATFDAIGEIKFLQVTDHPG